MSHETERTDEMGAAAGAPHDANRPPALLPHAELPPTNSSFADKASDLQALRDAVVEAAGVGAGLWLSYLFVLFYLAIAVGGVTHRDLLFESPVKLPFLNVDLPLIGFFLLGPLLFLIVHAYVLLHFVLLAGKIGAFHNELQAQIVNEDTQARLRRQLPSNIFVQFLAGPREVRGGVIGFLLRLIAHISLVVGPLGLLVLFQFQFLPYHHAPTVWWHRIAVMVDLVLLWMLWPSVARGEMTWMKWRDLRRGKVAAVALASLAPVFLALGVATFPGEWLNDHLSSVRVVPTRWPEWQLKGAEAADDQKNENENQNQDHDQKRSGGESRTFLTALALLKQTANLVMSMGWSSPQELLVGGDVDSVSLKPRSLWSNRMVLSGIDVIHSVKSDGETNIKALSKTLSLRGRRLEGAVFVGVNLKNADFTGAQLQGAKFFEVDLRNAKFGCDTDMVPGFLMWLKFFWGGSAICADLDGAWLDRAKLQGASFDHAKLRGTLLTDANLQGANLTGARLQSALLLCSQLQGAVLDYANLQGAALNSANLQAASLVGAYLEAATLSGTQLQGASLKNAKLQDARLDHIFAWRADPRTADHDGARITAPEIGPKYRARCSGSGDEESLSTWSAQSFATLSRSIEQQVPEGENRAKALERIAMILDPTKPLKDEQQMAAAWIDLTKSSPPRDTFEKALGMRLGEIGCGAEGAPYVIRGLIWGGLVSRLTSAPERVALVTHFLDEEECSGARGLSEEDKASLRGIRDLQQEP